MTSRILVVDDEPSMLDIITTALKKAGFAVTACRNGDVALEWAAEHSPHLMIMDLMMPGLGGLETLQYMRQLPALRDVPAIMLAAKEHPLAQVDTDLYGAQGFLAKPFSPNELVDETRRLLAGRLAAA